MAQDGRTEFFDLSRDGMVKFPSETVKFAIWSEEQRQPSGTWNMELGTGNTEHRTTAIRKYTEYNYCNYVSLVVMAQDGRTEFLDLSRDGMVKFPGETVKFAIWSEEHGTWNR